MAHGRSPILLLVALAALFALPANAFAQGDPTLPVNTTPATPGAWQTSPYVVTLQGTDVEDPAVDIEWRLAAGGAVSSVASGSQITIPTPGVHDFQTQAVDDSGNTSGWRSEQLRIDTVDPTDATSPGPSWHRTATTISVSAVDITSGVNHVEWILDGAPTQTGPNGSNVTISANGVHTLRTRAVDNAGNASDWIDHTIQVDTVEPTDTTALPVGWRTGPVDVTVAGLDEHSGIDEVLWVVDGGPVTSDTPSGAFTISAEGAHTVQTLVRDVAGNESGWQSHAVNIDATAPTNLTDTPDGDWTQAYHVLVEASDSASGVDRVEWQIDGGPWLHGPSGSAVDITGTGEYDLRTRARDVAGNVSAVRLDTIQVDQTAPANTTAPTPGGPVSDPYQVAVTGTDADAGVASVEWQVDGGTIHSGTAGVVATVSGDGAHTLRTRVIDGAGNASGWRTDTATIDADLGDTLPPVDTTTAAPAAWRPTPIPVTVAATDAPSGVAELQWRIDGQPLKSSLIDDPSFAIDEEGDHLLETRARDNGDRWSTWREQTFKVDLTPPQDATTIPAGWQPTNAVTLSGTDASSGIDEIQYRIDGGPVQHGADGQSVPVGADGTHLVSTRVIDDAGHASAWKHATLKVDTVDPSNTTTMPGAGWLDGPLELALSGTDLHLAPMQWRIDGGAIQDGGPAVIEDDGEYLLETRAIDDAGNFTNWLGATVSVDATAPENTTPLPAAGWRKTPYSVVVTGDDGAGSGVDVIERTIDGGAVSNDENATVSGDGVHTLRSRIVDNVAHFSAWRDDVIRIDGTAPSAAISCNGGSDAWSRGAVSCALGADDATSGVAALTLSRNGGAGEAVASGASVQVAADGTHVLALSATDAAGNHAAAQATVHVDATAPLAALSCSANGSKHVCRADASDATSGLAALGYSVDGGAYEPVAAGGSFTVAKGKVALRAVDVAGNETVTTPVTLVAPKESAGPTVKVSSVPVYLAGHTDVDSLVGALNAARSTNGTVSLDLRPLAVGRGRFRVEIAIKAGKRSKRLDRTYTVGRGGALPRIAASLAKATDRCTVTLTVRKRAGSRWRRYAGTRLVLAK